MDPFIGRTLGRYEILDELSRGGMGVVYRARDTRLHREVAVKVLPVDLVADADRKQRFLKEAQTASQLEHPNIGVIYEVDELEGTSFIAMELIRGEKLSDLIKRGELSTARALDLATEVAEGLALAHEKGVVHRDMKPANIMVTEQGHAKIIDFGLAKLVGALSGDAESTAAATAPGVVMGTAAYMSPEQARAGKVDYRTDIFSFGVVLYEMLARHTPFGRQSGIDTLHALLHDPPLPLPTLGPEVAADAGADLQRIVEKCLAKDPGGRYQGLRDVVVDLRAARRRLESGATTASHSAAQPVVPALARRPFPARAVTMAAIAVVVVGAAAIFIWPRWRPAGSAVAPDTGTPTLAVMYFQNNTGDPKLDWLRTGLTEMIVTDLSQSPDVEILGTDRLVQILKALRRQNDPVLSFDTVQEIARRAGVRDVVLGNYMKSGDTLRINVTLQEAATGRIVSAERIDAAGESSLFPVVDNLTRRLKTKFALPPAGAAGAARGLLAPPGGAEGSGYFRSLSEVTTTSTDAYRLYAQGIDLHQRGQEPEAIPLFEQAIALDPGFALALAKLAVVESNTGHWDLRDQYAKRALDHADRLSPRERFYIEGYYYGNNDGTLNQAIDAYKKAIELYPDHTSAIHNLASLYQDLERYDEAIPLYQALLQRSEPFMFTFANLAIAQASLGRFEQGRSVFDDLLHRQPANAAGYRALGHFLTACGKADEAQAALDKADSIDGGGAEFARDRWPLAILQDKLVEAVAWAQKDEQSADSFARWIGSNNHALNDLYRGRSASALAVSDRAAASEGPRGSDRTARIHGWVSAVLLRLGRPAPALSAAQRALRDARSSNAGWEISYYAILAQSRLGQDAAAATALDALAARANALPSNREKRQVHWLIGVMALDHHQTAKAIEELRLAESMLPPHALPPPPPPPHVPIWFDLGSAYLAAGDDANAAIRFQRVIDSTERIRAPIEFVRSLYFLGQIAERRGDRAKASEYYRRFVGYWGDGDMDRDRVADARQKLAAG